MVFKKGCIPWNKGINMWKDREHPRGTLGRRYKMSEETKRKISKANLGNKHKVPAWNKGLPNPELSKRQRENNVSTRPEVKLKLSKARLGVRPWNWNGGHSKNRKYVQREWKLLIKEIYKRDNWTCFDCGKQSGILNAHHIKPWSKYPELAFNKNNIITLCLSCHAKRHQKKELNRFYEVQEVSQ